MKQMIAVVLLVSVFWATAVTAHYPYLDRNPGVRFTGALLPLDEQSHGDLSTLTVFIQGKHWLFRLAEVEELTGRSSDWAILRGLFRRQVRFYGPASLIAPLQKPEIAGKLLTVKGRLYTRERRFLITAVEEVRDIALQNQQGT
jgi:hypothetical protein